MGTGSVPKFHCLADSCDVGRVLLSGEIVGDSSTRLEKTVMSIQSDFSQIVMDMSSITRLDMKCLLSICSLHRSLLRLNKGCCLSGGNPELIAEIMSLISHPLTGRCFLECSGGCIWTGAGWLQDEIHRS